MARHMEQQSRINTGRAGRIFFVISVAIYIVVNAPETMTTYDLSYDTTDSYPPLRASSSHRDTLPRIGIVVRPRRC